MKKLLVFIQSKIDIHKVSVAKRQNCCDTCSRNTIKELGLIKRNLETEFQKFQKLIN